MIVKPTVLVLGAGASQHLDYPLGSELKRQIQAILKDPASPGYQALETMGYTSDQIGTLYQGLSLSGRQTIDAFLEHRRDLLEIGKAAIAVRLVQCERVEMLFEKEPNWYSYLYARMNSTFNEFARNELTIITFNYDRSLEAFLFLSLKNSYGKTDEQTSEAMKSLPIIHVHGSLGPLPWQEDGGRDYTPTADAKHLRAASRAIRIVHENTAVDQFTIASNKIRSTTRVVFLGFGYDRTNLARLGLDTKGRAMFWGSTYGMTPLEMDDLRGVFAPAGIELGMQSWESLEYFRNAFSL